MLDKIVIINRHEAIMIFTHRDPVRLHSDGDVREMIDIIAAPIGFTSLNEYTRLRRISDEDTVEIDISEVA